MGELREVQSPKLSVIVPCCNGGVHLRYCLDALARTRYPFLECIVVNDGSTDDTAQVLLASPLAVHAIHFVRRRGAAGARNAGARVANGDILVFLDSDVCVHSDAISRIAEAFADDAGLGAVFGSYDDRPSHPAFHSQYRNLLHSYVHQTGQRQACTFWTGLGAVRRELFFQYGGFPEQHGIIDDVEFGWRLARAGVRIELRPEIQAQHRKQWTFSSTVRTDLLVRGIAWTRLVMRERQMPDTLNLRYRNRASVALVWLAVALALPVAAGVFGAAPLGGSAALICAALWLHRDLYAYFRAANGGWFAVMAAAAHLLHLFNCGIAFGIGCWLFAFELLSSRSASPADRVMKAPGE